MEVWRATRRWLTGKGFLAAACSVVVFYLVLGPLATVILSSIKASKDRLPFEATPFSLNNYVEAYLDPTTYQLLLNTAIFAGGSLIFGITLAVFFAWLVERTDMPGRNLVYTLMLLPMAMPGLLTSMGWVLLLSPRIGFINVFLRTLFGLPGPEGPFNIYTLWGMIFVSGLSVVPTSFLMIVGAFRNMDPALEEASAVSGFGVFSTLRRITLPLMLPAILSTVIYFFILVIEMFEVPLVIGTTAGIRVFSTSIYYAIHPDSGLANYGMASTLAMIVLVLSVVLIYVYGRMTKRAEQFATITGKGYRPRLIKLGPWKYMGLASISLFLILKVIFPFIILLWGSLRPYYSPPSLKSLSGVSFDVYRTLWTYPGLGQAAFNTLIIGVATGILVMLLSSIVSWIVVRTHTVYSRALAVVSFLPVAIPGVVIGLAVMILYLFVPIPIYGTVWIIVVALSTRYIAFGVRTMSAALMQIHKELEEASALSSASWGKTFWRVSVPLLLPSIMNGWLWVLLHASRDTAIVFMLAIIKNRVLANILWTAWSQGEVPTACALGVSLMLFLGLAVFAGRYFVTRRIPVY